MLPDIPLFGSSAPPAVRKPIFEIAFSAGASGGGDGGLLGAATAAVASVLGVGGGGEDPWKRSVARIVVEVGLAPDVDSAQIVLADDSQAPPVALADEGTIKLGYDDEGSTLAFTGKIEALSKGIRGAQRIAISNGATVLAALRIQKSFEDQTAGDVVKELASQGSVALGDSTDGSDLSFLVLDAGRSAWEHIARLARVSGHLARITEENKLDFRPPDDGDPVQTFTWGVDIMALDRTETEQSFDAVTIAGEGAAGSEGKDAWNWLTKTASSVTGSAGGGSKTRPFSDRALRSGDAVQAAADAFAAAAARAATTGVLLVPGAPKVVPAHKITLASTPGGAFDGEFLVTRVRHTYDKRSGFRTRITFTGTGGGAGGGLGGLLGGLL